MLHPSRLILFAVIVVAMCTAGLTAIADEPSRTIGPASAVTTVRATVEMTPPGRATRAVGTLQYDNDTPFRREPTTDHHIGNRFAAGVVDPHSIASVSFRMAQNYASDAVATIWDVNAASVQVLQRWGVTGLPATTVTGFLAVAPVPTAIVGHSGSFIGGMHNTFFTGFGCPTNSNLNGTCDGVALTAGTVDPGMGFHAVRIPLAGGVFTPTTNTVAVTGTAIAPASNAIFRVTGDNLPVELMGFVVE